MDGSRRHSRAGRPDARRTRKPLDGPAAHQGERAAFSLIELLVVIAVIALLLAILAPSLDRAKELTRRAVCAADMRSVGTALFAYAQDHAGVTPAGSPHWPYDWYGQESVWHPITPETRYNVGLMIDTGHLSEPRLFYCPSNTYEPRSYEGSYGWRQAEQWGWSGDNDHWAATNYMYRTTCGGESMDTCELVSLTRHSAGTAVYADDFAKGWGLYSHAEGYNVLRLGGDVRWYADPELEIAEHEPEIDNNWHPSFAAGPERVWRDCFDE
jgi:prepilin-type N-terminal cleavage/methylation domain-containing protein